MTAIVDTYYDGQTGDAGWIVESPINRRWYQRQSGLHPNSALFSTERFDTSEQALRHMIWSIEQHFPEWETISVVGIDSKESLASSLDGDRKIYECENGFVVCRR